LINAGDVIVAPRSSENIVPQPPARYRCFGQPIVGVLLLFSAALAATHRLRIEPRT
jgi:hypothetical protein